MKHVIWDIETFPNIFSAAFKCPETGRRWLFEISWRKDQRRELVSFLMGLAAQDTAMVGFNSLSFDYPVIHYIVENPHITVLDIYRKAQQIINTPFNNRFAHIIWDRGQHVPQIDLMKVHHFDNVARMTGLKVLEFNLRMDDIRELPFHHTSVLSDEQIETLLSYGDHDVDATDLFYRESQAALAFRETLTEKYGRNVMNDNDTKIGKGYFIAELEKHMPGICYDSSSGSRKPRQTPREVIHFKDVIFDYVRFDHPEFQRIHQWFLANSIKGDETKGAFKLDCTIDGFQFSFGTGGIHGAVSPGIYSSDENFVVESRDVRSYYPNLAIKNRIFPAHLSEKFCDIYEDVYDQRQTFSKGTPENAMLKLALNGTFGDSNNQYSPFFDPQYTMVITINGQLLLCMLAEQLMKVPTLQMLMINTDGLEYRVHRRYTEHIEKVCRWWQDLTKLDLESDIYKKLCIRDCNNYIGVFEGDKVKRKGAYEYELGWHQNHSALVIPKAAEAALVHGTDIREFIENHEDIHDFMLRMKVPRNSVLVTCDLEGVETQVQNISRYYVSIFGQELVKIMPPTPTSTQVKKDSAAPDRRFNQHVGWRVTVCNDIRDANPDDIEHEFYIQSALKLVDPLRRDK